MATILETCFQRATTGSSRIVFPEGEDDRVVQAAAELAKRGITDPILVGRPEEINRIAENANIDVSAVEIHDSKSDACRERYTDVYRDIRGVRTDTAQKIIGNELIYAALAVRSGDADGMIGGCVRTSGELISASSEVIGLSDTIDIPSSFFLMELPDGEVFVFADPALNENPTAEELADITVSTAESSTAILGWEPRVALLSFSTKGSATHPDVKKVQRATELATERRPEMYIDGEFQADAALNYGIAERKLDEIGEVAGQATVLIFPDLDAANISYKLTQELGGAKAYGPILQGFAEPVSDLSRGASVEDIVGAATITSTLIQGGS